MTKKLNLLDYIKLTVVIGGFAYINYLALCDLLFGWG